MYKQDSDLTDPQELICRKHNQTTQHHGIKDFLSGRVYREIVTSCVNA